MVAVLVESYLLEVVVSLEAGFKWSFAGTEMGWN
jgi:hypothetical protein